MKDLIPLEFRSQRILTTKILAEAYGTEENNINKNFSTNKDRFIEGKHYFKLQGQELKEFKRVVNISNDPALMYTSVLMLWTERGAARHAKILDTDEAWQVYEELEDNYFRVKDGSFDINELSPELQLLQKMFNIVVQNQLEQNLMKEDLSNTKEQTTAAMNQTQILTNRVNNLDATNIEGTPRQRLNAIIKKYAFDKGLPIPSAWHEFRKSFNMAYKTNLEQRKNNYQGKYRSKNISYPDYLEKVGLIEDALRVADKMINSGV